MYLYMSMYYNYVHVHVYYRYMHFITCMHIWTSVLHVATIPDNHRTPEAIEYMHHKQA